jgi:hypothetical protein
MIKKKLFVQDSKGCATYFMGFHSSRSFNEAEFKFSDEVRLNRIPRDYDAYLLHLSDISLSDLEDIRREQPWSWIYAISGVAIPNINQEVKDKLDGIFSILLSKDYDLILERVRNYRESGSKL